jgi:hypothetical protein
VILCAPESERSEVIGVEGLIVFLTGASAHVRNRERGAIKIDEKEKSSVMASMTVMKTPQIGDFPLEFFDKKDHKTMSGCNHFSWRSEFVCGRTIP